MANLEQEAAAGDLDLSIAAIPEQARMPPFSLTMAWWAVCSAVFYIVVGATLALGYGARNALIGMALSVVAYGLVNSVISRYAVRTGLSVALFSRVLFGSAGAALATLIFFATAIYYAVFEGSVIAVAAHHVVSRARLQMGRADRGLLQRAAGVRQRAALARQVQRRAAALLSVRTAGGRGADHARIRLQRRVARFRAEGRGARQRLVALLRLLHGRVGADDVHLRLRPLRPPRGRRLSRPLQLRHAVLPGHLPAQRRGGHLPGQHHAGARHLVGSLGGAGPAQADGHLGAAVRVGDAIAHQHRELLPGHHQHAGLLPASWPGCARRSSCGRWWSARWSMR